MICDLMTSVWMIAVSVNVERYSDQIWYLSSSTGDCPQELAALNTGFMDIPDQIWSLDPNF